MTLPKSHPNPVFLSLALSAFPLLSTLILLPIETQSFSPPSFKLISNHVPTAPLAPAARAQLAPKSFFFDHFLPQSSSFLLSFSSSFSSQSISRSSTALSSSKSSIEPLEPLEPTPPTKRTPPTPPPPSIEPRIELQPHGPIHTLILIRHGDSYWNGKYPGCEETFTGWTDIPLSPIGVKEAKRTGELLSLFAPCAAASDDYEDHEDCEDYADFEDYEDYEEDKPKEPRESRGYRGSRRGIDALFTSTLTRAKMTAHYCWWAYYDRLEQQYSLQKQYQYYNLNPNKTNNTHNTHSPNQNKSNKSNNIKINKNDLTPGQFLIDHRLNERHYGALQGFTKSSTEAGRPRTNGVSLSAGNIPLPPTISSSSNNNKSSTNKSSTNTSSNNKSSSNSKSSTTHPTNPTYPIYTPQQVKQWRRSWHAIPPPLSDTDPRRIDELRKFKEICGGEEFVPRGESLKMVAEGRVRPFLEERVTDVLEGAYARHLGRLRDRTRTARTRRTSVDEVDEVGEVEEVEEVDEGGTALIVAHANSLRALIGVICNVEHDPSTLKKLEAMKIPTASPLVLRYRRSWVRQRKQRKKRGEDSEYGEDGGDGGDSEDGGDGEAVKKEMVSGFCAVDLEGNAVGNALFGIDGSVGGVGDVGGGNGGNGGAVAVELPVYPLTSVPFPIRRKSKVSKRRAENDKAKVHGSGINGTDWSANGIPVKENATSLVQ